MTLESQNPERTDIVTSSAPDYSELFPHLQHPPIVEAVLDFRAPATVPLEEVGMRAKLAAALPDYPKVAGRRLIKSTFSATSGKPPEASVRDLGFAGIDCRTQDEKQVAQFYKDGFLFSRLHPYERWDRFLEEALRLWNIHLDLARPEEIKRIGVRFINRMLFPLPCERLQDYLTAAPVNPPELRLPVATFLHQELRAVPGTPYLLNLIKTMQPIEPGASHLPLILDADVFTEAPVGVRDSSLTKHLKKMRWLKNKAFFATLTAKAIETFR